MSILFFLLRWCRAQKFDGSQIPVTTGRFVLRTPNIQCSYLTHYAIRLDRLSLFGVLQFATLQQEWLI